MLPLRDDPPVAALLPHGPVLDDGSVLLTPPQVSPLVALGLRPPPLALGRVWIVQPRAIEHASEALCLQVAGSLATLLEGLPEGSMMQVCQRIEPVSEVPDWSALRRDATHPFVAFQQHALAQGLPHGDAGQRSGLRRVTTLVTLRLPLRGLPLSVVQRLQLTLSLRGGALPPRLRQALDGCLAQTREGLDHLGDLLTEALRAAGIPSQRLEQAAALSAVLAQALQPGRRTPPVLQPGQALRDQVLAAPLTTAPGGWDMDGLSARVLSLQAAPAQTYPGMLTASRAPQEAQPLALGQVWPGILDLTVNIAVPNREAELARVRTKRQLAYLQRLTLTGASSPEADALYDELDTVQRQAFTTGTRLLQARVHVTAWGPPDRLTQATDALVQAGQRLGLAFLPEPVLGATLFLQTLPLGFDPDMPAERLLRRTRRLLAPNLAHLLPLYGDWRGTGTPTALYLNRRGEPVAFDPFDLPTAPHLVVYGASGAGKSFWINHLVAQVLPLGATVVILDRLASYDTLCTAGGGRYVEMDLDHAVCVNPFLGPLDREHQAFLVNLLAVMAAGGEHEAPLSRVERAVLAEALGALAQAPGGEEEATLSAFVGVLRLQGDLGQRLALQLTPFYGQGVYAGFFDGPSTFALDPVLTVIELSRLRSAPDLQSVFMLALLHHLTGYFADPARRGQRKYLISDETWALLQHATSAQVLEEVARTFRKLQTCAIFVSQQGGDFASRAGQAIRKNAGAYVLLQQSPEEVEAMRTLFDLSEQEVTLLKQVRRRPRWSEAYLRLASQEGGIIRLVPDAYLRWLASQHPPEHAARTALAQALEGDLHRAVATLAQRYPDGLEGPVEVTALVEAIKNEERGHARA